MWGGERLSWHDDVVQLKAEMPGATWPALADVLGSRHGVKLTPEQVRSAWRRRAGDKSCEAPHAASRIEPVDYDPQTLMSSLRRMAMTIPEIADLYDRSPKTISSWLERARADGYPVQSDGSRFWSDVTPALAETQVDHSTNESHLIIGIASDPHKGSKMEQRTYFKDFYQRAADRGVKRIYMAGDGFAGIKVYRGQAAEIHKHTWTDQINYFVDDYPHVEGVETEAIGGNHDWSAVKDGGTDPWMLVVKDRPDIHYLGPFSAWVKLAAQCFMYMLHPAGGGAYALSYKPQKLVESFQGGKKPHIAILGHWHRWMQMLERNVYAMLAGCFEAQTSFQAMRFLQPQICGTILEIGFNDDGSVRTYRPEVVSYLVPREDDYPRLWARSAS